MGIAFSVALLRMLQGSRVQVIFDDTNDKDPLAASEPILAYRTGGFAVICGADDHVMDVSAFSTWLATCYSSFICQRFSNPKRRGLLHGSIVGSISGE